ncbi:DNA-3-methyladenine glycosylase family protein [Paenibacillus hexagrammi]|uniref:DNA-3-methyladenine glycosylase family protein n=1 Tax=Paenibacillus hexagrammi TaxID=2908839 RepID=UPI0028834B7D|nr:DNA-3-methyladenine glycosylase [Paenibacillus sp. YPD9-1]
MKQINECKRSFHSWDAAKQQLTVHLPQPFRFEPNISYLARSKNECMYHVDAENGQITKLFPWNKRKFLLEINCEEDQFLHIRFVGGGGQEAGLGVRHDNDLGEYGKVAKELAEELLEDPAGSDNERPDQNLREECADNVKSFADPALLDAVASYVWEWFDLGRDLQPFYELAEHDPLLQNAARKFYGLRILGIPDLFEAISWGIIGQQINLPFAYTLKRRLVEGYGSSSVWNGRTYWSFPEPAQIAELTPNALTSLQFTGKKAEYLIGAAQLITEGKLSKAALLYHKEAKAAENELLRIRGIGPWTANYVMMRCLRDPSAFPIADVGLHNALKLVMDRSEKPSLDEIKELAVHWKGWEAYATFYLWRTLY